jgi:hypothetical protein
MFAHGYLIEFPPGYLTAPLMTSDATRRGDAAILSGALALDAGFD